MKEEIMYFQYLSGKAATGNSAQMIALLFQN